MFRDPASALRQFEDPSFDVDAFLVEKLSQLTPEGVDAAKDELAQLNEFCADEVEQVVHDNHVLFLEACRGIEDMEDRIQLLRNYINSMASLIGSMRNMKSVSKQVATEQVSLTSSSSSGATASTAVTSTPENQPLAQVEDDLQLLLQQLDVSIAQRDYLTAKEILGVGEDIMKVFERDYTIIMEQVPDYPSWKFRYQSQFQARRSLLVQQLEHMMREGGTAMREVQEIAAALTMLVGDCHATHALLECHSSHIAHLQNQLLKDTSSGGGDSDGLDYAAALAQHTCLSLGHAMEDVLAVLGESNKEVLALMSVWAASEMRQCAQLLRRHVLVPYAAASGLVSTLHCVTAALVFVALLEVTHRISLTQTFIQCVGTLATS